MLRFGANVLMGFGILTAGDACKRESQAAANDKTSISPPQAAAVLAHESDAKAPPKKVPALERHLAKGRVVAVGDIHGDLTAARRTLKVAKLIDEADHWIGGNSALVQTGDILDRGDDERPLLEWLERLAVAAEQAGGSVYRLNGNHEIMNVAGDFRYVTERGFAAFADYAQGPIPGPVGELPESQRGRAMAFLPGGPWARRLAQYPVVLIVNDTIFTHGGLLPKHVEFGLVRYNQEISAWMRGTGKLSSTLAGDDAPFWVRTYGDAVTESDCGLLDTVLDQLAVKRLVVGHTPQKGGITFACGERVARIDVGLASYYGNHAASALEIQGDTVKILTEKASPASTAKPRPRQTVELRP